MHSTISTTQFRDLVDSPTLFSGNAGLAITQHLLSAIMQDEDTIFKAKNHLDAIGETIGSLTDPSFGEGLAGIGWAVEILTQNYLLSDVDTDEVLSDIDDFMYKDITKKKETTASLYSGAMGKAAYFLKRAKSKNQRTHRYIELVHLECLTILTDDIDELFRAPNGPLSIDPEHAIALDSDGICLNMKDLGDYLQLFSLDLLINKAVIETAIYDIMSLTDALLE